MSTPTPAFVDGIGVLLTIARSQLSGVSVFEDIPDQLSEHLPALVISRAGGASEAPVWHSRFLVHLQVWSDRDATYPNDPFGAAYALSRRVSQLFYAAWRDQTVAYDASSQPIGWIARWRESSGFQKTTDPDLPHLGRYVAVCDLLIRNPRTA